MWCQRFCGFLQPRWVSSFDIILFANWHFILREIIILLETILIIECLFLLFLLSRFRSWLFRPRSWFRFWKRSLSLPTSWLLTYLGKRIIASIMVWNRTCWFLKYRWSKLAIGLRRISSFSCLGWVLTLIESRQSLLALKTHVIERSLPL